MSERGQVLMVNSRRLPEGAQNNSREPGAVASEAFRESRIVALARGCLFLVGTGAEAQTPASPAKPAPAPKSAAIKRKRAAVPRAKTAKICTRSCLPLRSFFAVR